MTEQHSEPPSIDSMQQLLAMGAAMEREAIAGYAALSARIRAEGRADLCAVFDHLIAEESEHLALIETWSATAGLTLAGQASGPLQARMFDDEGARAVAPELLNAYRAFTMAVRNEERAFTFWAHVAAHAPTSEVRGAAERMAREELGHIATLRKERRRAFHEDRHKEVASPDNLAILEVRLAESFEARAAAGAAAYADLARDARERCRVLETEPFSCRLPTAMVDARLLKRPGAIAEWLLDAYLHLAEHEKSEDARKRAQILAADLIRALEAAHAVENQAGPGEPS